MAIINYPLNYDSKSLKYTAGSTEPSYLEVLLTNQDGVIYPVKISPSHVDKDDATLTKLAYDEIKNALFANSFQKEAIEELTSVTDVIKEEVKKEIDLLKASFLSMSELPEDVKEQIVQSYPKYKVGESYKRGDRILYEGELYEVVQDHISQEDWVVSGLPGLYKAVKSVKVTTIDPVTEEVVEKEVISEFTQPTGAHDAYSKGGKVIFEGKTYESLINSNVYSPKTYAQGWKEVVE